MRDLFVSKADSAREWSIMVMLDRTRLLAHLVVEPEIHRVGPECGSTLSKALRDFQSNC